MSMLTLFLIALAFVAAAVVAIKWIGGDITVIDDWKKAWRFYSVWAFAVVGILPDAYNAIVASGLLTGGDTPEALTWGMRLAAIGGIFARLVSQVRPPLDDTDSAGA